MPHRTEFKRISANSFQLEVHIKCKVTALCILLFNEEAVIFCGGVPLPSMTMLIL